MRYIDLARKQQYQYASPIVLARTGNKIHELADEVDAKTTREESIKYLTLQDTVGLEVYKKSVKLLLFKAFYQVLGEDQINRLNVLFSLGPNLYLEYDGTVELNTELLANIKEAMMADVMADIPLEKITVPTETALQYFRNYNMRDKEQLFKYRRVASIKLFKLGDYLDYFFGDLVYSTGVLKVFDLELYKDGFLLRLPTIENLKQVSPMPQLDHLYDIRKQSFEWAKKIGVTTVGDLNDAIVNKTIDDIIIMQEAMMERQISDIAETIVARPDIKFVMIAGPSSSGKTSSAHRLAVQLKSFGITPHPISADDYFINRADMVPEADGSLNFESIDCVDTKLFNDDMVALLNGETVSLPTYNFVTGEREYRGNTLKLGEQDILIIEGIHCLNDKMSYALPVENKFRIYVSAMTQIRLDEHNRIPSSAVRLLRRMTRDDRTRGTSAQKTIQTWNKVRAGEEENIFPYQENADVMFNSCTIYELLVLKPMVEPLLYGVPRDSVEYIAAKELLKFLDSFLSYNDKSVPINSLLKEFIGGSYFNV